MSKGWYNIKITAKRAVQSVRRSFPNKEPAAISGCPISTQAAFLAIAARDCDQEHIECFRRCWNSKPPWPIERGKRGHYLYCTSKCLAEYMECLAEQAAEKAFDTMSEALDWLKHNPGVAVGTLVVVGGVVFVVMTGGGGALILAPAAL